MNKSTSFISTTPLDILAVLFCVLFILNCIFFSVIIATVVSQWIPIKVEFDVHGYDILITKKTYPKTGYGIMFQDKFKIWRYNRISFTQVSEQQLLSL